MSKHCVSLDEPSQETLREQRGASSRGRVASSQSHEESKVAQRANNEGY